MVDHRPPPRTDGVRARAARLVHDMRCDMTWHAVCQSGSRLLMKPKTQQSRLLRLDSRLLESLASPIAALQAIRAPSGRE
jgi:hypothetical protein